MIEFIQAPPEHIEQILPQEAQAEPLNLALGHQAIANGIVTLEQAVVARDEDCILGVGGVTEVWPGVARIWALFSQKLIDEHAPSLARRVQRGVSQLWMSRRYHRLECTVLTDHEKGIEFLRWLGFEREGRMRKYTPTGEDSYLYAKVERDGV